MIEPFSGAKTATMTVGLVNNYSGDCTDIKIMGKIPFEGNKYILSGSNLGSTFSTVLNGALSVSGVGGGGVEIYYSTEENPTVTSTSWTSSTAGAKSYLVVLTGYAMPAGHNIEITYNFDIPADIDFEQATYGTFAAYYTYEIMGEDPNRSAEPDKVGLKTSEGPKLAIEKTAFLEGLEIADWSDVREGDIIEYKIRAINEGSVDIYNLNITDEVLTGITWVIEEEVGFNVYEYVPAGSTTVVIPEIPVLTAGTSSATYKFTVRVDDLPAGHTTGTISNQAVGEATNPLTNKKFVEKSNIVNNNVKKAELTIKKDSPSLEFGDIVHEGDQVRYTITVKNRMETVAQDVVVTDVLPKGVSLVSGKILKDDIDGTYNEGAHTLIFNLGNMEPGEVIMMEVKVYVDYLEEVSELVNIAKVKSKTTEEVSSRFLNKVQRAILNITKTSNIASQNVKPGDIIEYTITVSNTGDGAAFYTVVTDKIPEGTLFEDTDTKIYLETEDGYINWNLGTILAGESKQIKMRVEVVALKNGLNSLTLANVAKVVSTNVQEKESNEVVHEVARDESDTRYKISGVVWLDANKNGQRDNNEKLMSNIQVILVNSTTGSIIKDQNTGQEKRTTSAVDGSYTFNNLIKGNYVVVFMYDGDKYGVTTYQKSGVPEELNSNAIYSRVVDTDGVTRDGAVTDKIVISDNSKFNVDLGLIENPNFDLVISKYVSKITVKNKEGTKVFDYNTPLAKVDIKDKYMAGSEVTIEYKITVSNRGDVAGYATSIMDNLPSDIQFKPEQNAGWSKSNDGKLYYTGLKDMEILTGESKVVSLVVTKTLNSNSTINVVNTAEIQQSYNVMGALNRSNSQGKAETLITVKTGEVMMYLALITTVIFMLGIGVYLIKKKVL